MITFIIVLVVGIVITIVLAACTLFLQGYMYTETSPGILWQAPAAGGAMTVFLLLWCLINANSPNASPNNIPYNTIFEFRTKVDLLDRPAQSIWSINKEGKKTEYRLRKETGPIGQTDSVYVERTDPTRRWTPDDVTAIILQAHGEEIRFEPSQSEVGGNLVFVSPEGWTMPVYDRMLTGQPSRGHAGLFYANLAINVLHFVVWFLCLWLLLRFQWVHALGLALFFWIIMTVLVVPMLLNRAVGG